MTKELKDYLIEKTHDLINAPSCSKEAKDAAQKWLDAVGTENEKVQTKKYIEELEEDIMPIDGLIGFLSSEASIQLFGADTADKMLKHAKELKASNAQYCDCPACSAAAAILEKKSLLI